MEALPGNGAVGQNRSGTVKTLLGGLCCGEAATPFSQAYVSADRGAWLCRWGCRLLLGCVCLKGLERRGTSFAMQPM